MKRFAAILALGLATGAAQASTITLGLPDISGFSQLGSSTAGTITVNNGLIPAATAYTFTTIFVPPQTGAQTADVGLAGLNIAFGAGDDLSLNLKNTNENPWDFQLVVVTDQGVFSSALQSLKSSLDTLGHDQGDEPPAEDAAGDSDEDSDRVALHTRAYPLLQLLESAVRDEQAVMWDYYDGSYI